MRMLPFLLPVVLGSVLLAACGHTTTRTPAAASATAPRVSWKSPTRVDCGPAFFPPGLLSRLRQKFGADLSCFRFSGQNQWILVGTGETANTRGMTDIGPMVAVDTCATSTCLDANTEHALADFRLSFPPNPVIMLGLVATHGTSILVISNCRTFDFDTRTLHWYPESTKVTRNLLEGRRSKPLPTAPLLNAQTVFDSDMIPPQTLRWCGR